MEFSVLLQFCLGRKGAKKGSGKTIYLLTAEHILIPSDFRMRFLKKRCCFHADIERKSLLWQDQIFHVPKNQNILTLEVRTFIFLPHVTVSRQHNREEEQRESRAILYCTLLPMPLSVHPLV